MEGLETTGDKPGTNGTWRPNRGGSSDRHLQFHGGCESLYT